MKINSLKLIEIITDIWREFSHKKLPIYLLILLSINLILSPLVQAATRGVLSRGQSYALGLLGLVTFSLFIYLFAVIFEPEKF